MIQSKCKRLLAGAAVLILSAFSMHAQEPNKSSDEFRKAFLEKFARTGLSTTPGDAIMLRILIESSHAKRGIEVGVAAGFGAMNMGIGFERNGGQLFSLEIDPKRAADSRQNVAKVALEKTVTVMEGDALKLLPTLTGEFDFIFIDAAKEQYFGYLKAIEPKLKRGALVVADNVIVSARAMKDYLDYVQTSPNYETVIVRSSMDKNDGMAISYKLR